MTTLNNMYTTLLRTAGVDVNKKGHLYVGENPLKIGKSKVVLPTKKYLDKPGNKILYHPFNEDITSDKSLTIAITERAASIYYNRLAVTVLEGLMDYSCDSTNAKTLTNKQQLLISSLGVAYKTHRKLISRILKLAKNKRTTGLISINVNDKDGMKIANYHSPLLECLDSGDTEVYGIKLTKKQKEMLQDMLGGYINPTVVKTPITEISPTGKALFLACDKAIVDANKFIGSGIPLASSIKKLLRFDFGVFDNRSKMFKIVNSVPAITLNTGSKSKSEPSSIDVNMKVDIKPTVKKEIPPWEEDTSEPVITKSLEPKVDTRAAPATTGIESMYVKRGGNNNGNNANNSLFNNNQNNANNEIWRQGYGNSMGGMGSNNTNGGGGLLSGGGPINTNNNNNDVLSSRGSGGVLNQGSYNAFTVAPVKTPQRGYTSINPTNQDMLSRLLNK